MADEHPPLPLPPPVPPPPPLVRPAHRFDSDSWLARNKVLAIVAAILAVYLIRTNVESRRRPAAARGDARVTSSHSPPAQASENGADSTASFVPRSRPAESAPPSSSAAVASSAPLEPSAPTKEAVDFVMPDYTGRGLQSAQNDVQQHGVFFSRSHDLRGSRRQLFDRNWQVCTQTPVAGDRVHGSRLSVEGSIDFGVVKNSEDCP